MPAGKPPLGETPQARRLLYGTVGILVAVLLIGTGLVLWFSGNGTATGIGGPFTLQDGSGKTVTDADYRGSYMLVYFGYTFCPDVCPTTLNAVADAVDRLGADATRLRVVFISVDPKRDTPAVVKQYAAAFGPHVIGLTGTAPQIAKVAGEYRVYYQEHRTGPGPNDYSMDHSSILYLIDPQGRFVAPIPADQTGAQIASSLKNLMR